MACDGEIAPEEYNLMKSFSEKENLFDSLSFNEEFNKCLDILKEIGSNFINSYFQAITTIDLNEKEKLEIIDIAVRTILADNKVEYSEIKFFKSLVSSLDIDKDLVIKSVPNIEDYWLEEDLSGRSDYQFFDNSELSINIPENIDVR